MSQPKCQYCRHRFDTDAALAAHVPCPDRTTGDRPTDPVGTSHRPSTVEAVRVEASQVEPAERWWLCTWTVTTTHTERVTGDELWHDPPASMWRRFGDSQRVDPADLDPAVLLELLRRFETEYTADPVTERSLRTVEATTDPNPGPAEAKVDGGEPR